MREEKTDERFSRVLGKNRETAKKSFVSFFLVIAFLLVGFFLINLDVPKHNLLDIKGIEIAEQNVQVDLAVTGAEQEQGLSDRQGLNDNEGMLFIFDQPGKYPFWMKDMNFPIDIIWIGEDQRIVYIKKDARPELYPEVYGPDVSDVDAIYILEVVAGFSKKNNLKVGDIVEFTY